jgi:hypothetical protein
MTLASQLLTAFTRVGTEFKTLRGTLGVNSSLTTTAKDTLVNAINEVKAGQASAGAQIDDTTAATTTVYSSSKTQSVANASATAIILDSAANTATGTTYSASKIQAVANAAATALINDSAAAGTTTFSSTKINTAIAAAITALINGAPTTYDTLKEISDYIASDTSAGTAMTTSIAGKIDFNNAQTYTSPQVVQGIANLVALGVAKASDLSTLTTNVGDTTTDFAGAFVTSLS